MRHGGGLEAGWKVTQALEGQAPKSGRMLISTAGSSPEGSKRQHGLGDKARAWKRKTWIAFEPPPLTHPPPAKGGGGAGVAGLSSCSGGLRPLVELCVEPAGLCGRCTGVLEGKL